jgi:VWFA-related protein
MKSLALLLLLPAFATAQEAPILDSDTPITLEVTRVNLLFTVTDARGRFMTDLKKDDFEITENKKKQSILEFTAESDLPLRLAILVDSSNTVRPRFRFIQDAAINFIQTAMRPGQDKALLVSFDTQAELKVPLTGNTTELTASIRRMQAGGGTALHDAIYLASTELTKDEPHDKYRRAIIILSDGEDTLSNYSRAQALEMAHKSDSIIYTVSTNITHSSTSGDKVLKYLAEQTGGLAFFPFKESDLDQSFVNVVNELRHQYNVLYRPEPLIRDGKYHTIDVRVKSVGNMIVRARQGYYAPGPDGKR